MESHFSKNIRSFCEFVENNQGHFLEINDPLGRGRVEGLKREGYYFGNMSDPIDCCYLTAPHCYSARLLCRGRLDLVLVGEIEGEDVEA
jgi:hypothetical protein